MLPGIRRDESLARLEVARCNEPDRLALAPIPGLLRRRRAEDAVRRARPREDLAHERHERERLGHHRLVLALADALEPRRRRARVGQDVGARVLDVARRRLLGRQDQRETLSGDALEVAARPRGGGAVRVEFRAAPVVRRPLEDRPRGRPLRLGPRPVWKSIVCRVHPTILH